MAGRIKVAPPEQRTADNIVFASKKECLRYQELKAAMKAGIIRDLRLQIPYQLIVNGIHITNYVSDFCYIDGNGKEIVEDVKGFRTEVYRLKKKLVEAIHGIRILET